MVTKKKSSKTDPKKDPRAKGKKNDTISPYYAAQTYGSSFEKKTAKDSMKGFFEGSPANKRKETEAQHMERNAKKDSIDSARVSKGVYNVSSPANKSIGKKLAFSSRKK